VYHGGASEVVRVTSPVPATVEFYTYYYPGWRATVDGHPVTIWQAPPFGLIQLEVPAGEHVVALRFGGTPIRTAGAVLTLLSLCLSAALWMWRWA